jgi:hypothetical protein
MLAIVAAVIFGIILLIDLTGASIGIDRGTLLVAGLLCLALHLAGIGVGPRTGTRRWSVRR